MNIKEYLMQEFGIDEKKAEEVSEKLKELAHQHHHHEGDKKQEVSMILETEKEVNTVKEAIAKLHCNGCEKHCSLLSPGCGRGRKAGQQLLS